MVLKAYFPPFVTKLEINICIEYFFIIEPLNFELSRSTKLSASITAVMINDNSKLKSDDLTSASQQRAPVLCKKKYFKSVSYSYIHGAF